MLIGVIETAGRRGLPSLPPFGQKAGRAKNRQTTRREGLSWWIGSQLAGTTYLSVVCRFGLLPAANN